MKRMTWLLVLAGLLAVMLVIAGCSSAGIKNKGPTTEQRMEIISGGVERTLEIEIIPERTNNENMDANSISGGDSGRGFRLDAALAE